MSPHRPPKPHRPSQAVPVPPQVPEQPLPGDPAATGPRKGPRGAKAPKSAPGLPLPHERDESPDPAAVVPDPVIAQAKRDIDAGMVDTDMRATPGLDAKARQGMVPGPGGKPPTGR